MKVFLSSTSVDLIEYRQAAAEALERLGLQVGRMETFGARPVEPSGVCLSEIESCDLFVGIYAHRYGYIPNGLTVSITEAELRHARKHNKPIFCFVVEDHHCWPRKMIESGPGRAKLIALKAEIASSLTMDTFNTPDNLAFKIATSVALYINCGKASELAMRLRTVLTLMNEGRRYQQYTIAKLASIAGLPRAGELERYFSGEEEPTFAFVDHFSSVFGVNPSWLKFGEGTPYSTEDTLALDAIHYYERIVSLKPTRIFFVQDESPRRKSGIVLKLTDWKYHTLPRTWPICSDVGGTGRYQIYSFYQLTVRVNEKRFLTIEEQVWRRSPAVFQSVLRYALAQE
jgi:hypothetical protein